MDSHAGASGDVNNDGLVDFIQFPIPSEYNGEPNEKFAVTNLNLGGYSFNSIDMFDNTNFKESGSVDGLQLHMIFLILTQMDI